MLLGIKKKMIEKWGSVKVQISHKVFLVQYTCMCRSCSGENKKKVAEYRWWYFSFDDIHEKITQFWLVKINAVFR